MYRPGEDANPGRSHVNLPEEHKVLLMVRRLT